jgi:hypothetical protein
LFLLSSNVVVCVLDKLYVSEIFTVMQVANLVFMLAIIVFIVGSSLYRSFAAGQTDQKAKSDDISILGPSSPSAVIGLDHIAFAEHSTVELPVLAPRLPNSYLVGGEDDDGGNGDKQSAVGPPLPARSLWPDAVAAGNESGSQDDTVSVVLN